MMIDFAGRASDGLCRSANHPNFVVPLTQPTRREGAYCVVCWADGSPRPRLAAVYTTCRSSLHPRETVVCLDDGINVFCPRCEAVEREDAAARKRRASDAF